MEVLHHPKVEKKNLKEYFLEVNHSISWHQRLCHSLVRPGQY
jgi:hypothetical protein